MENIKKGKYAVPPDPHKQTRRERRGGRERRHDIYARFPYLLANGRRESARREEDRTRYFFFDRYNQKIFAAIITILMLSITDAMLTLMLIERGSSELNPVMAYFLEYGTLPFIVAKYVLTSFGVLMLLIFKNVFISKISVYTQSLFACVIVTFAGVICWELFLLYITR